jgi:hypothetical protein
MTTANNDRDSEVAGSRSTTGAPAKVVPVSTFTREQFEDLREGDLVVVRISGVEVRARVESRSIDEDDTKCEVRLGHGACEARWTNAPVRAYRETDYHDLGDGCMLDASSFVRKVTLKDIQIFCRDGGLYGVDWLGFAARAYDWMRFTLGSVYLDHNTGEMLSAPWKYMAEAWLGGCDGLEAPNA